METFEEKSLRLKVSQHERKEKKSKLQLEMNEVRFKSTEGSERYQHTESIRLIIEYLTLYQLFPKGKKLP